MQDEGLIALRRGIGYVIQETGLFPHFTVERNVGLVLEIEGRPREERIREVATCWPQWDSTPPHLRTDILISFPAASGSA